MKKAQQKIFLTAILNRLRKDSAKPENWNGPLGLWRKC